MTDSPRRPRDVLADRIEQWADTEDWHVYDYADRLLKDLEQAGFDWIEPGRTRPTGEWIVCGQVDCTDPAALDVLHCPGDGQAVYVPLCAAHLANPFSLEYVLETHGFFTLEVS